MLCMFLYTTYFYFIWRKRSIFFDRQFEESKRSCAYRKFHACIVLLMQISWEEYHINPYFFFQSKLRVPSVEEYVSSDPMEPLNHKTQKNIIEIWAILMFSILVWIWTRVGKSLQIPAKSTYFDNFVTIIMKTIFFVCLFGRMRKVRIV